MTVIGDRGRRGRCGLDAGMQRNGQFLADDPAQGQFVDHGSPRFRSVMTTWNPSFARWCAMTPQTNVLSGQPARTHSPDRANNAAPVRASAITAYSKTRRIYAAFSVAWVSLAGTLGRGISFGHARSCGQFAASQSIAASDRRTWMSAPAVNAASFLLSPKSRQDTADNSIEAASAYARDAISR